MFYTSEGASNTYVKNFDIKNNNWKKSWNLQLLDQAGEVLQVTPGNKRSVQTLNLNIQQHPILGFSCISQITHLNSL